MTDSTHAAPSAPVRSGSPKQTRGRVGALLLGAAAALAGCGEPGPSPEVLALGKEVYHRPASCVTCHQEGGLGVANAFPPLRDNPDLSEADPTKLIKIVTHGLGGEIEALGETYDVPMAGLGSRLSPEEIAAVLTYVRSSWRNVGGPVTVEQVIAVQEAYPDRTHPWTVAELESAATPGPAPGRTVDPVAVAATGAALPIAGGAAAGVALASAQTPDILDGPALPAAPPRDPVAWGESLYLDAAQCASCHMADGAGVAGAYPPLADSPWVTGEADRLIKVALHGVGGEMEILGETYNAEMPGQGALLDDAQMAATLSYVRQAWGNRASPVYPDQVKRVRDEHAGRHKVWPAAELAKLDERSTLTGLRYLRYTPPAEVDTLADFDPAAAKAAAEGSIDDGYIDLHGVDGKPDGEDESPMVVVFEADFEVPAEDQYVYSVESSGGVVLEVDGSRVLGRDTFSGFFRGSATVLLSPGTHRLRLVSGTVGKWRVVKLSAQAPSLNRALHRLSKQPTEALQLEDPSFLLVPERDTPIVLRGRFENQSKRGVGVGHPLRINWAFDFYRGQLTRAWRGDFVNAAARWNGRNDKYMTPAGDDVLDLGFRPPLARLASPTEPWPGDAGRDEPAPTCVSLGMAIVDGVPQMFGQVGGVVLRDAPRAEPGVGGGAPRLARTLDAFAAGAGVEGDPVLHALLADGAEIDNPSGGVYEVDGAYRVTLDGVADARLHEQDGRTLLIAPATWESASEGPPAWSTDGLDWAPDAPVRRARWGLTIEWMD